MATQKFIFPTHFPKSGGNKNLDLEKFFKKTSLADDADDYDHCDTSIDNHSNSNKMSKFIKAPGYIPPDSADASTSKSTSTTTTPKNGGKDKRDKDKKDKDKDIKDRKKVKDNNNNNNNNSSINNNKTNNNDTSKKNVGEWGVDKVVDWLKMEKLDVFVDKFKENDITGKVLYEIEQSDLEKMGFNSIGNCKSFFISLKKLKTTTIQPIRQHQQQHQQHQHQHKRVGESSVKFCDYFLQHGNCKFGDKCKYSHERPLEILSSSSTTTTTTTTTATSGPSLKQKEERNKKLEKQKEKKDSYIPFKSNFGIHAYLAKVKSLFDTQEEVISKMQADINLWEDILSRTNLDNQTINDVIGIFTNDKVTQSFLRENINYFYSILMKSNFIGHYSNLPNKIQSLNVYDDAGYRSIASLFKQICDRFQEGVDHIPLELFNSQFQKSILSQTDTNIAYIIKVLSQRKLFRSQNQSIDVNSDETSYKDFPLVPVLDELRSKKFDSRIRPLKLGIYDSPDEYLNTHFHLLREDMIHPIRETLADV
ncbi:hypothetical protein CYY_009032, partial [Polysphondylium violaceum]